MAGSVWGRDSSSNFFSTSNHFSTNWKTWLRAIFTPAIPPPCALGFKNGSFWGQNQATMAGSPRDPGINVETLSRLITSILIGKHDIGSHSPLPSFPPVVGRGGGTMGEQWLLKQFCLNHPVEHIQKPKLPKLYVRVETSTSYFIIHNQFVK